MPIFEVDIRGAKYQIDAPDEAQAATQVLKLSQQPQHFELGQAPGDDPSKMPGNVSHNTWADKGAAFTGSVLEGVPIAGPALLSGAESVAAGLAGVDKKQIAANAERQMADNPGTSLAGNVTGAVAGMLPAVAAAPEAFGAGGGGLLLRSLISAMSGAAIGGADSGVRDGVEAIPSGAAWGGALGLLGPGAGRLVGAGTRAIASRFGGGSAAEQAFGRAAGADAVNGPRLQAMGPDAMPMDLGPNLRQQAGALAATPGRGQGIVREAVQARDVGANARIRGGIDANLGPAPIPSQVQGNIRAAQEALGPRYEALFQNARAVNTTPIAHNLEAMAVNQRGPAQRAVQRVREMLNITGTNQLDPHPRTLLATRQAIDDMLADETAPNAIRVLTVTRQQINSELERAVPNIREVDAQFAELARQHAAVDRGRQVLQSGETTPHPVELAGEVAQGALPQGAMVGPSAVPLRLQQGTRAKIDHIIGNNANDRVAMQRLIKGDGDWNRDKLVTQFGVDRTNRLLDLLDRERVFAETSNEVTRNSLTASRQAAQKDVTLPEKKPGVLRSAANLQFGEAAARAGDRIASAFRGAGQESTNTELARLLTSNDPQSTTRVINIVQAAQRRGDISAQKAKEIMQSLRVSGAQQGQERQPLKLTVRKHH